MKTIFERIAKAKSTTSILIGVGIILLELLLWVTGSMEIETDTDLMVTVVVLALFAILGLFFVFRGISARANYKNSSAYKRLSKYIDVDDMFIKVDEDISDKNYLSLHYNENKNDVFLLNEKYIFVLNKQRITFILSDDLLWTYYKKLNNAVGTLYLWSKNGEMSVDTLLPLNEIGVVIQIADKMWHVNTGYDDKLRKTRESNYRKFTEICEGIKSKKLSGTAGENQ